MTKPRDSRTSKKAAAAAAGRQSSGAERPSSNKSSKSSKLTKQDFEALQAQLLAMQKENETLKAQKRAPPPKSASKRRGKRAKTHDLDKELHEKEIEDFVKNEIWRETKFLANDKELDRVCQEIIDTMPQFLGLRTDDEADKDDNLATFVNVYGGVVCKAINSKRSTVQGSLGKAYQKRYDLGEKMPTVKDLKTVILRHDLEKKAIPEDANEDEAADIRAYNDRVEWNWQVFDWYWEYLLPCVVGKFAWGHGMRNYCTISRGTYPDDPEKKYITSSDEALTLVLMENCAQRFPFSSKLHADGVTKLTEEHKKHPKYQSKYSLDHLGNVQWGGWTTEGRDRYKNLWSVIATNKRKDHVYRVEKAALLRLQAKNNIKTRKTGKTAGGDGMPNMADPTEVSFIDIDSEDEMAEDSDIEDADDNFLKPYYKDGAPPENDAASA